MRQIKFRAWDKVGSCMLPWGAMTQTAFNNGESSLLYDVMCGHRLNVELLQFTGLKDCNGVEIYESDIVKARLLSDKGYALGSFVGSVVFEEFEYGIETNDSGWPFASWSCVDSCEVIGNIFQHKELLE